MADVGMAVDTSFALCQRVARRLPNHVGMTDVLGDRIRWVVGDAKSSREIPGIISASTNPGLHWNRLRTAVVFARQRDLLFWNLDPRRKRVGCDVAGLDRPLLDWAIDLMPWVIGLTSSSTPAGEPVDLRHPSPVRLSRLPLESSCLGRQAESSVADPAVLKFALWVTAPNFGTCQTGKSARQRIAKKLS